MLLDMVKRRGNRHFLDSFRIILLSLGPPLTPLVSYKIPHNNKALICL